MLLKNTDDAKDGELLAGLNEQLDALEACAFAPYLSGAAPGRRRRRSSSRLPEGTPRSPVRALGAPGSSLAGARRGARGRGVHYKGLRVRALPERVGSLLKVARARASAYIRLPRLISAEAEPERVPARWGFVIADGRR